MKELLKARIWWPPSCFIVFVAASLPPRTRCLGADSGGDGGASDSLEIPAVSGENVVANRKGAKTLRGVNVLNKSVTISTVTGGAPGKDIVWDFSLVNLGATHNVSPGKIE